MKKIITLTTIFLLTISPLSIQALPEERIEHENSLASIIKSKITKQALIAAGCVTAAGILAVILWKKYSSNDEHSTLIPKKDAEKTESKKSNRKKKKRNESSLLKKSSEVKRSDEVADETFHARSSYDDEKDDSVKEDKPDASAENIEQNLTKAPEEQPDSRPAIPEEGEIDWALYHTYFEQQARERELRERQRIEDDRRQREAEAQELQAALELSLQQKRADEMIQQARAAEDEAERLRVALREEREAEEERRRQQEEEFWRKLEEARQERARQEQERLERRRQEEERKREREEQQRWEEEQRLVELRQREAEERERRKQEDQSRHQEEKERLRRGEQRKRQFETPEETKKRIHNLCFEYLLEDDKSGKQPAAFENLFKRPDFEEEIMNDFMQGLNIHEIMNKYKYRLNR